MFALVFSHGSTVKRYHPTVTQLEWSIASVVLARSMSALFAEASHDFNSLSDCLISSISSPSFSTAVASATKENVVITDHTATKGSHERIAKAPIIEKNALI